MNQWSSKQQFAFSEIKEALWLYRYLSRWSIISPSSIRRECWAIQESFEKDTRHVRGRSKVVPLYGGPARMHLKRNVNNNLVDHQRSFPRVPRTAHHSVMSTSPRRVDPARPSKTRTGRDSHTLYTVSSNFLWGHVQSRRNHESTSSIPRYPFDSPTLHSNGTCAENKNARFRYFIIISIFYAIARRIRSPITRFTRISPTKS